MSPDTRVKALSDGDCRQAARTLIEREHKVEGALRSEHAMNIKRLMDIGAYRRICGIAAACPMHPDSARRRMRARARGPQKMAVGGKKVKAGKKG